MRLGKRFTRHPAHCYDCHTCGDRFIGYGDDDPKFIEWRDRHNSWHNQGIQEAGRHTMGNPRAPWYMPGNRDHVYTMEV